MTVSKSKRVRSVFTHFKLLSAILLLLATSVNISAFASVSNSEHDPGRLISSFLDENGRFQNPEGYIGTVDPGAFNMRTNALGEPVFSMNGIDQDDNWTLQSYTDGVDNQVFAMAVVGNSLYVGGTFTTAGEVIANNIARYDIASGTWHNLGSGVEGEFVSVNALVVDGDNLYVGGRFSQAGGVPASYIARYDMSAETWHSLGGEFSGVNSRIRDIVITGNNLYVGGAFTVAGGVSANNLARYDLTNGTWHNVGTGVEGTFAVVNALASDGDNLYLGGNFTEAGDISANGLARYDFSAGTWHTVGTGVAGPVVFVNALVIEGDDLYVGGRFTHAGGSASSSIARYDISTGSWHSLGSGITYSPPFLEFTRPTVEAIVVEGDDVFAGGSFDIAGGITANRVARYNRNLGTWHNLDEGTNLTVRALAATGENLFAGGNFQRTGDLPVSRTARFDRSTESWHTLGTSNGIDDYIHAVAVHGNDLYIGGSFNQAGGIPANKIARYNMIDGTWQALATEFIGSRIYALAISGDDLYVGGTFSNVEGVEVRNIARYNMTNGTWHALGDGVFGLVFALAVAGDNLYVGGSFSQTPSSRIARYDMNEGTWHALGDGVNSNVRTLLVSGNNLYAGGDFTQAGGESANRVARYDLNEETWHSLGSGVNSRVRSLVRTGNDLYVGGEFSQAGGSAASRIARFDISEESWHALGSGVTGASGNRVNTIAISGNDLFVGGKFIDAEGSPASNIAHYDISTGSWQSMGSGVDGGVDRLITTFAIAGNDLYVGGEFSIAGGKPAARLARWSGLLDVAGMVTLVSPANEAADVGLQPELSWEAELVADEYQVQLSENETFSPAIQDTVVPGLSIIVDPLNFETEYFWRVRGINDAGSGEWSEIRSFSTRNMPRPENLELVAADGEISISWDAEELDETSGIRVYAGETTESLAPLTDLAQDTRTYSDGLQSGTLYAVTMFFINDTESPFSNVVIYMDETYLFSPEWELVSVPINTEGAELQSSDVYGFSGVYSSSESLLPGLGYWVRSDENEELVVAGNGLSETVYSLRRGWNLIGSLAAVVSVSSLNDPDGILTSAPIYAYSEGAYTETTSLAPGRGYWLFASDNGEVGIELSAGQAKVPADTQNEEIDELYRIRFSNSSASQYLFVSGMPLNEDALQAYRMPPVAPAPALDVRAGEFRITDRQSASLQIVTNEYPLQVLLETREGAPESNFIYRILAIDEGNEVHFNLLPGVEVLINRPFDELVLERLHRDEVISEFALEQNYPNPFNPATTIRYQLAAQADVSVMVYDILGRRVASLVNSTQQPGRYSVVFDASHLSSGVYLLRIQAGDFTDIQKMTLIK